MKKIGILTFHNAHNYGAVLQAYALQKVLSKSNDVELINYKNKAISRGYRIIRINKRSCRLFVITILSDLIHLRKNIKRYKIFQNFINKKLNLTKPYKSEEDLKNNFPKKDIYITGSDQVWNSQITQGLRDAYTLNFGDSKTKRISYAASIGNANIKDFEKDEFIKKLSNLNYISVREENAKKCLQNLINNNIEVVLDPTLLVKKEEWDKEIINEVYQNEKYILAYVVAEDNNHLKILNKLSEKTGLKVIHFGSFNDGIKNVLANKYTAGPLEFISLVKNAEYIVCTSFHATVFSIIFNKKFWVIPNKKTGSRVTNLLEKLDISERAVKSLEEFEKLDYDKEIDYEKVNKKLEEERKKSIDWLNNAINS